MIEEGININERESFFKKNNNIIVEREGNSLKRIDFLDRRCYQRSEGVYYPSVTSILTAFPPSSFLLDWMKEVGLNADILKDRAAREGTQVHEGIETLLKGEKLDWVDDYGNARYNLNVWKMLLRFQDFFSLVKPVTFNSELFIYSDTYKYAGTTDYLCKVGNEIWLLDFKTSNHLSPTYNLQLSAYAEALKEQEGIIPDRHGILWLKAATKTQKFDPSRGLCQGEGWQIVFDPDPQKSFEMFKHVYEIYKFINPKVEPHSKSYPVEISL